MSIGNIVDDPDVVITVTIEDRHERVDSRQIREWHVLDPKSRAGRFCKRAKHVECGEKMRYQFCGAGRKQGICLARADDDTWRSNLASELNGAGE
jgi:hypothetical protein